jgi:uracil-DNA glycosylase
MAPVAAPHPALGSPSLAAVQERLAGCRLCVEAGDVVEPPPVTDVRAGHRAIIVGQAPGIHEPVLGRPFAADAGARLRRWFAPLGLDDEERFRATFALTAVAKCYPGRDPGGRGDRRPAPSVCARCEPWTEAQIELLDPPLVIPVGGLAIGRLVGAARLVDVVGRRFARAGRVLVPLPHPSGASAWLNVAEHRRLVERAVELVGEELART